MTAPLRIDGLRELNKAAKEIGDGAPAEIKAILNEAATIVVKGARNRVPVRSGKLRDSIKVASSGQKAQVKSGSKAVPYAGFVDFGGDVGRHKATKRPYKKAGRFVLPAYEAQKANIAKLLQKRLTSFIEGKGLNVDG